MYACSNDYNYFSHFLLILVNADSPKDVSVIARPSLVVEEKEPLTLECSARSDPPVTSVTWRKMSDGETEILGKTQTFSLKSVSPSDSGLYSCEASNDVGTGNSPQTELRVKCECAAVVVANVKGCGPFKCVSVKLPLEDGKGTFSHSTHRSLLCSIKTRTY